MIQSVNTRGGQILGVWKNLVGTHRRVTMRLLGGLGVLEMGLIIWCPFKRNQRPSPWLLDDLHSQSAAPTRARSFCMLEPFTERFHVEVEPRLFGVRRRVVARSKEARAHQSSCEEGYGGHLMWARQPCLRVLSKIGWLFLG